MSSNGMYPVGQTSDFVQDAEDASERNVRKLVVIIVIALAMLVGVSGLVAAYQVTHSCADVAKPNNGERIFEPVLGSNGCVIDWQDAGLSLNDGPQHQPVQALAPALGGYESGPDGAPLATTTHFTCDDPSSLSDDDLAFCAELINDELVVRNDTLQGTRIYFGCYEELQGRYITENKSIYCAESYTNTTGP